MQEQNPALEPEVDSEEDDLADVPSLSDPFVQKYFEGRDALIEQEKKQRSDRAFRENLSPMAVEACAIVDQIRFEESQTLWTRDYEDSLSEAGDVFPGMMFALAKDRIRKSRLWDIVRRLPKGALLHCHMEAMVDIEFLLDQAFATPGMCEQQLGCLSSPERRDTAAFSFGYVKQHDVSLAADDSAGRASAGASIWTSSYVAGTPVPLLAAATAFPSGGRAGFVAWVRARTTITLDDCLVQHRGVNDVWRKFIACFPARAGLICYEPLFRAFVRELLRELRADGVRWVDLRSAFITPFVREGAAEPDGDFDGMLTVLEQEIEGFKRSKDGEGFWGARMIWTTMRAADTEYIIKHMRQCITLKQSHPSLICGYDLVGQEDLGRPLADLLPELLWFRKACADAGVELPLFLHAGECLGDGDGADSNLFDALLLGTRRLGHAFSLHKHPLLLAMARDRRVCVESCPVSNEVLRLAGSVLAHPLPALLARGVPAALCNDDPAILGQGPAGMSHDFWQALQGWENLGLAGLGSLAENSVRWATFEGDLDAKTWNAEIRDGIMGKGVRAQRLKEWTREWEHFCQWVVLEYGQDENFDGEEDGAGDGRE
ncbi:hypothetical protein BDY21DRAFT_284404 [Lineolata rhizophorae]|uniref:adenosine deaminase n=1 Tax=Lineolata rhizophorae TaxID=578093 RepID=A0A6A6P2I9_9PEZI|nr:hypothetical protein BDY21DRAFT_284404 [Lineolata rhizophorae]